MSYERGNDCFVAGNYEEAAREYSAALAAGDDAVELHENLGLTLWKLGRFRPAARALLRALDGNLVSREQALRILVSCCFRGGQPIDGERLLTIYERAFGAHPEQWVKS